MRRDVVIIGAGLAGVTLARELRAQGRDVLVLERSRGAGGRCASRRIDDVPVDHGIPFLHGRSPRFCAELAAVAEVRRLAPWPTLIDGDGSPCRPEAFSEHEYRVAFVEGVNRLVKHIARDVDIQLNADVVHVEAPSVERPTWIVQLAAGDRLEATTLVLTLPAPSAVELLRRSEALPPAISSVLPLVDLVRMLPCLVVMARYGADAPLPTWEMSLPRTSAVVHSIIHDSRKRPVGAPLTLVIQARPAFSRAHQDDAPDEWAETLLAEAASLHGEWVRHPVLRAPHRWRKARVDPGSELSQPVVVRLASGAQLAFAGDGFHHAGGVEGAYLSGIMLATRLAGEK